VIGEVAVGAEVARVASENDVEKPLIVQMRTNGRGVEESRIQGVQWRTGESREEEQE
jgi:hypothetical protein